MAETDVDEFLEHFGVRGMKWGVRKEQFRQHRERALIDKNFKNFPKRKSFHHEIMLTAEIDANKEIRALNKKYEAQGAMKKNPKSLPTEYYDESYAIINKHLDSLSSQYQNTSGTQRLKAELVFDERTRTEYTRVRVEDIEAKHASLNSEVVLPIEKDENGMIISVKFPKELFDLFEESLEQDALDVTDFLEHFGVRGMRWGVRNKRSSSSSDGPAPISRRTARADKKFEKVAISKKNRAVGRQLLLDAAKNANDEILALNKKYSRNEHQLVKGVPAGSKEYYDEVYSVINKHLDALSGFHENASNTRRWKVSLEVDEMGVERLRSRTEEVEHSSMEGWVDLPYTKDSNGLITNVEFPEELFDLLDEPLEQDSMSDTEEFLAHHGIKGMKWGVRRKNPRRAFASSVAKPADTDSEDGKSTRDILKKQKKHGTVALTNHELRTINARQKLEQEFAKANPEAKKKLDKGHDQVKRYLAMGATAKTAYDLINSPAGKALRGKGANKAAELAAQKAAQKAMWKIAVGRIGSY